MTFDKASQSIFDEAHDLLVSKQKDYGPGAIRDFGEYGVLVRLNDKVSRLKTLLGNGAAPNHETIEDTWKDIANYAIIALMVRRGLWGLPMGGVRELPDMDSGTATFDIEDVEIQ